MVLHSSQVKVDLLTFLACEFTYNKYLQHLTFFKLRMYFDLRNNLYFCNSTVQTFEPID